MTARNGYAGVVPRAIWSGSISFGLVNVPVRMYSAIDERDVRFHLLHTKDDGRIGYAKVCKQEGKPVPDDEIAKAYEVAEGEFVYLTDEDFEAAQGPKYHTLDLCDFVPYEQIDPVYFEHTYLLGPGDGAEKVYALLVKAMERSGLVGIGKYVMRDKQQLGCLRVRQGVLTLEKMYFADEIRPVDGIAPSRVRVGDRELEMARDLIDRLAGDFDIGKYRDDYREALLDVIEAKRRGESVRVEEPEEQGPPDLLQALHASLEAHRGGARGRPSSNGGPRGSSSRRASGNGSSASRQELVERAKATGVTGYSRMTKKELAAALSRG